RNAPIMVITVATEGHSFREGQAADKETNEAVRCRDHPDEFSGSRFLDYSPGLFKNLWQTNPPVQSRTHRDKG
ncbi:hypothetical protein ONP31_21800, partial [Salmonella enterica subsp. enterica serovar Montevideo]|nr:hypothetical protein [Salmonella enterica subsp. enterica serovar Montevideo]